MLLGAKDNLQSASRKAEQAMLSSDPLEMKSAMAALHEQLEMCSSASLAVQSADLLICS